MRIPYYEGFLVTTYSFNQSNYVHNYIGSNEATPHIITTGVNTLVKDQLQANIIVHFITINYYTSFIFLFPLIFLV